jgi:AcrR family transcriptional regulator
MVGKISTTLKVPKDQIVSSIDLMEFARQIAGADASGEILEQRFRRFEDGNGGQIWAEQDAVDIGRGNTLIRVTLLRGSSRTARRSLTRIAEFEQTYGKARTEPEGKPAAKPEAANPPPTLEAGSTSDIRRRQIVEGACEVISRKGYADASVREIAEAAGVSIPSLYQYVKSKEDILFLITEGCMQRLFDQFRETIGAALTADAKIEKAIADYLAYISDNRRYINLVYRETRSLSPENRERIFEIERALMREWEQIIRSGTRGGEFRKIDPFLTSNILYFACSIWSLRHWAIGDFGEDNIREVLTTIMLDGLRR